MLADAGAPAPLPPAAAAWPGAPHVAALSAVHAFAPGRAAPTHAGAGVGAAPHPPGAATPADLMQVLQSIWNGPGAGPSAGRGGAPGAAGWGAAAPSAQRGGRAVW